MSKSQDADDKTGELSSKTLQFDPVFTGRIIRDGCKNPVELLPGSGDSLADLEPLMGTQFFAPSVIILLIQNALPVIIRHVVPSVSLFGTPHPSIGVRQAVKIANCHVLLPPIKNLQNRHHRCRPGTGS